MTTKTNGRSVIQELSPEDARRLFDRLARRYLSMRGHDFIRKWNEGAFDADPERPEVMRLAMLLPLAE